MSSNSMPQATKFRPSRVPGDDMLPAWPSFELEIERSLRLLRELRLPVSLFALRFATGPRTERVVANALAGLGVAGRLLDGSLGLFYLGPRGSGPQGDAALVELVRRRACQALADQAEASSVPKVAAVHGWTDQGTTAAQLANMLASAEAGRSISLGGAMPGFWSRRRVAQPA